MNHHPQAPENNIRVIENFASRKSRCTTGINDNGGKFCHRYCWWGWYIPVPNLPPVSTILKEKNYLYVHCTTQRCGVKKLFWLKIFFICHRCQHWWCTLSCDSLWKMFEKIRNGPNSILRGSGKLIHENNLKSKSSWHCPFKGIYCSVPLPNNKKEKKSVVIIFFRGGGCIRDKKKDDSKNAWALNVYLQRTQQIFIYSIEALIRRGSAWYSVSHVNF